MADSVEELVNGEGQGQERPTDRLSTPQAQCWGLGAGEGVGALSAAVPCPHGALQTVYLWPHCEPHYEKNCGPLKPWEAVAHVGEVHAVEGHVVNRGLGHLVQKGRGLRVHVRVSWSEMVEEHEKEVDHGKSQGGHEVHLLD